MKTKAASDAFDTQLQWIGKTGHLNRTIYMPPNTISRLNYCVRPQIFGFWNYPRWAKRKGWHWWLCCCWWWWCFL